MMNLKKNFWKNTRRFKIATIMYVSIILLTSIIFNFKIKTPMATFLILTYGVPLLISINPKFKIKSKYKYILASISFISIYLLLRIYYSDIKGLVGITYYIPILYAYLLPDVISPVMVSLFLSKIVLSYSEGFIIEGNLGSSIGMVSAGILFSVISLTINRLYDSREMYKDLSIRDGLTGLYNLDYLIQIGEEWLLEDREITIVIFDIDNFKAFNDTYGHIRGNDILRQIGDKIDDKTKQFKGLGGRLGGDEFLALIPDLSLQKSKILYEKIINILKEIYLLSDVDLEPVKISLSAGMCHSSDIESTTIKSMLNHADMNMYYHKYSKSYSLSSIGLEDILSPNEQHLLNLLAEKDMYSYVHSKYVVKYTDLILKDMNFGEAETIEILRGAWLHDIGKLFVTNDILRKSAKLTDAEYDMVKVHVDIGLNIVDAFNLSERAINVIKYHQERWDGKGYPEGKSGQDTPIEGRIIQIADAFSAMTIKRVYRRVLSIEEALDEIEKNKGSQFDPSIADAFISLMKNEINK